MDGRTPRHQRLRTPRGPPTPFQARYPGQNPTRLSAAAAPTSPRSGAGFARLTPLSMDDDAITTLMDIDDNSPRSAAGAGFLDDDDEGDLLHSHRMAGGRGNEVRGPLAFAGFFNTFDGADFDDADLA